jgi:hypothetical protein
MRSGVGLRRATARADGDGGREDGRPGSPSSPRSGRRGGRTGRRRQRQEGGSSEIRPDQTRLPEGVAGPDILEEEIPEDAALRSAEAAARRLATVRSRCARLRYGINVVKVRGKWELRRSEGGHLDGQLIQTFDPRLPAKVIAVSDKPCREVGTDCAGLQPEGDEDDNLVKVEDDQASCDEPRIKGDEADATDSNLGLLFKLAVLLAICVVAVWATAVVSPTAVQAAVVPGYARRSHEAAKAGTVESDTDAVPGVLGTEPKLASVSRREREMDAYDCSEPFDVKPISLLTDVDIRTCEERELKAVQQQKTHLLLQKASRKKIKIRECSLRDSRLVWVCGSASHSAMSNLESYFDERWPMTAEECNRAWDENVYGLYQFGTQHRDDRPVQHETRNSFTFQRTGWTKNGGTDVLCGGGNLPTYEMREYQNHLKITDKSLHHAVATDYVHLDLYTRDAYIETDPVTSESRLVVPHLEAKIAHCDPFNSTSCVTAEGTFVWDSIEPDDICDYYKLRKVTGIDLKSYGSDGEPISDTFVSDGDNAMIRIRRSGKAITDCGAILQPTEYPELFFSDDLDHPELNRPVPPSEVSPFLHSNVADSYVFYKMQDSLAEAVLGLQRNQCEKERRRALSAYASLLAKQKSISDGDTASLGGGLFITSSGESGFMYWCRSVVVEALPLSETCYSALPVQLRDEDAIHLRKILAGEGEDHTKVTLPQLFREPKSGRLTTVATEMACVPALAPLYRNRHGNWIKMTHVGIHQAPVPGNPRQELDESYFTVDKDELPAPGKRSIYNNDTILHTLWFLAAQNLRDLGAPRAMRRINNHNAGSSDPAQAGDYLPKVDAVLPDFEIPSIWDALGLQKLRVALAWWAEWSVFCNGFVGTYLLYRLICYVLNLYNALFHPEYPGDGVCLRFFEGAFPSLAAATLRGYLRSGDTKGPCYGCATACLRIRRRRKQYEVDGAALTHHRRAASVDNPTVSRAGSESEPPLYPQLTPTATAPSPTSSTGGRHIPPLRSMTMGHPAAHRPPAVQPTVNRQMVSCQDGQHVLFDGPILYQPGTYERPSISHQQGPPGFAAFPPRAPRHLRRQRSTSRGLRRCKTPLPPLTPPGGTPLHSTVPRQAENGSEFEDADT